MKKENKEYQKPKIINVENLVNKEKLQLAGFVPGQALFIKQELK